MVSFCCISSKNDNYDIKLLIDSVHTAHPKPASFGTAAMLKPVSFLGPDASNLHSTRPICVRSCRQASHTAPRRHTQGFSYQSLAHRQPVSQPRSAEDE